MEDIDTKDIPLVNEDNNELKNDDSKKHPCKSDLDLDTNNNNEKVKTRADRLTNIFLLTCIVGVSLGIILEVINTINRNEASKEKRNEKNKYWVYSAMSDVENKNGILKHVHLVLDRIGYEKSTNETPWDLLWSHDYPFTKLHSNLNKLKPRQKVNHFPGTGYISNKVDLATTDSKYIPKAFKLPESKEEFLKYAKLNKNAMFLEKHNRHRGVFLKNVSEIDVASGKSFVQEYMQNPFLVDGHKFDIGVYVTVTSVNPLRVYWFKGDVLFRYCPAKYNPFDPKNLDKYVVGDDYLPTWQVPSLARPYIALGYSMKDTFDIYAKSKGKDPSRMWEEIQNAIAEIFITKEHYIVDALKHYSNAENFFEMMRFDLIVDEDLKVYLLEANMSPNLSSSHYPPNQMLYEQVLYNLFSLVGVVNQGNYLKDENPREQAAAQNMVSSEKNIAVFGTECNTICKDDCEAADVCKLCKTCLDGSLRNSLLAAHREFLHKGDFRRLIPPPMVPVKDVAALRDKLTNLTPKNKLLYLWYQGKCNEDITWCN